MRPESGFWIAPNWSYIGKMTMTSQYPDITSSSNVFDILLFFRSSLVTSPYFMIISSLVWELSQFSLIKDWQEIQKPEVLPNICRLGQVRDFKFGMNVSNEMLLNAAKCQGYNFYRFWIINEKSTGVNCSYWYTELYAK